MNWNKIIQIFPTEDKEQVDRKGILQLLLLEQLYKTNCNHFVNELNR